MSGFVLRSGLGGNAGVYQGPAFGPAGGSVGIPAAQPAGSATVGTGQAQTISQRAFGITGAGADAGPRTAHYGVAASGLVGVGLLLFIWWSLPR